MRWTPLIAGTMLALAPASAFAHGQLHVPAGNQVASAAALERPCPGDDITPDTVVTGEFGRELMRSYVFVPFKVPRGTTAVRVKYCFDKPDLNPQQNHTLDLGLYEDGADPWWGPDEFRGWGGSSHPDVTVSAQGFSTEAQYKEKPKGHVPGRTTRGFRPGPIEPGLWAAELGVAAVITEGDSDGKVAWRVEIDLDRDPRYARDPYRPARYPTKPVKRATGWYAGDVHVHGEHSALGDATMTELFGFAFKPRPEGAGLDWLTLSDYVSGSSWAEIGRHQPRYPGKLVVRSAEVITYQGHLNSHGNSVNQDYRAGALYVLEDGGGVKKLRDPRPPRETFERIHEAGGFTQINHPTIFPSAVFSSLCRGCPWDYSDSETDYAEVDAWEVHTGPAGSSQPGLYRPGPNPFTLTAIERWDELRAMGHRVTAVAASDSHNAGRTPNAVTQSPIGQGTTVVYADELSEAGIRRAFQLGRAFVKLWASDDPDLRLDAVTDDGVTAMMGDPLAASSATFKAQVLGGLKDGQDRQLIVMRDGQALATVPVTSDDFTYEFTGDGAGDYRLQLQRGSAIDGLTNPITLGADPLRLEPRLRTRRARAGNRTRFVFAVRLRAQDRTMPAQGVTVAFAGKRATTGPEGLARIRARIRRAGRHRATFTRPGIQPATVRVRVRR